MSMLTSPRPGLEFGDEPTSPLFPSFSDEYLIRSDPTARAPAELIYIDADPMGIESAYQTMRQILLDAGIDISDLSGTEIPEDLPESITNVLQSAVQSQDISGIQDIAQDIISAGGYGDWLETQDVLLGDPGAPPSEIPEEFSDLEFDEEGNLVFVLDPSAITLPPIAGPMPVEDIAGGGGAPATPSEEEEIEDPAQTTLPGDTIDDEETGSGRDIEDDEETSGQGGFFRVLDGDVYIISEDSWVLANERQRDYLENIYGRTPQDGIYDDVGRVIEEEPQDSPVRELPTIYPDRPVKAQQPTPTVTIEAPTPPAQTQTPVTPQPTTDDGTQGTGNQGVGPGTGPGTQAGTGDGVTAKGLMKPEFEPFMTALNYQPVQLQQQIAPAKKDYMQQLDALIGRSLFGKMLG